MAASVDPGGAFASNQHRRVLAHLSHPDDNYGWTVEALAGRMGTSDDLGPVLASLAEDGHAEQSYSGAWRMTQAGFDLLTRSDDIQGEEGSAGSAGPAQIEPHTAQAATATAWEVSA